MTMNCERVSNLLSAFIDKELSREEEQAIKNHLNECEACSLEYKMITGTKTLLGCLPSQEIPSEFWTELRPELRGRVVPFRPLRLAFYRMIRRPKAFAIAAAVLALVVILPLSGLFLRKSQQQPILPDPFFREHALSNVRRPLTNEVSVTYVVTNTNLSREEEIQSLPEGMAEFMR